MKENKMPSDAELKRAIELYKVSPFVPSILIDLAEAYLAVEGLPESIKISPYDSLTEEIAKKNVNEAIDACKLAILKHYQKKIEYKKYQPCGCVLCTCENEDQCQGCGAKNCNKYEDGKHPEFIPKEHIPCDYVPRSKLLAEKEIEGVIANKYYRIYYSSNLSREEFFPLLAKEIVAEQDKKINQNK